MLTEYAFLFGRAKTLYRNSLRQTLDGILFKGVLFNSCSCGGPTLKDLVKANGKRSHPVRFIRLVPVSGVGTADNPNPRSMRRILFQHRQQDRVSRPAIVQTFCSRVLALPFPPPGYDNKWNGVFELIPLWDSISFLLCPCGTSIAAGPAR
jgi:hypothetical protein